jgi:uncharacterized protein (TIGR03435 family)
MRSLLIPCLAACAFGQPSFTVASVNASPAAEGSKPVILVDPGRISFSNVSLKTMITRAYSVKDYQVTGPGWIGSDRFIVTATMPPDTPQATVWQMLQTLLAERFQMKIRRTTQELPVYALVAGKTPLKLAKAEGGEPSIRFSRSGLQAKNTSMANLANLLGALLDRPVVDQTELAGTYDLTLDFAPDPSLGPAMAKMTAEMAQTGAEASGPSIFTGLQQIGLKAEPRKAPVEMITVESASRVPTEN